MTRLVLISQSDSTESGLRHALGPDVEIVSWWPTDTEDAHAVVKRASLNVPSVVVLGPDLEAQRALDIATAFDEERPEIEVLLVARPTTRLLATALGAGVRDVLNPSLTSEEVREIVERAIDVSHRRRANLTGDGVGERRGRVIVVLSPKGGAGKTTIATNLAVGLARSATRQVVLFDLDLQFGDVSNALRLMPETTFGDSVRAGLPDITALKAALTPHPSGLFALCAPETPAEADDITGDHISRAIDMLHKDFLYVVVDSDAGLHERTLAAIERATDLIFVCSTDVPSVRSLRKELEALDIIGMTHQRRHFVLNRADARVGLSADDIQATVQHRIDVFIPSSRDVPISLNKGSPILESDTASAAAKALLPLVARFVEAEHSASDPASSRRSRLRRKDT